MKRGLGAAALAAWTLSGCSWLLGHGEVPQPPSPVRVLAPIQADQAAPGVGASATFLGVGDRIVTATNMVGRIARVVNPYGEDTFLFRVSVSNTGTEPVVVQPEKATLSVGAGDPLAPRTLDFYRRRWPAWAVTNDHEGEGQAAAYAHILTTLLIERQVPSGQSAEGLVAFPVTPVSGPMALQLPLTIGRRKLAASWRWML